MSNRKSLSYIIIILTMAILACITPATTPAPVPPTVTPALEPPSSMSYELVWHNQEPSGDSNPIQIPSDGQATAWVEFVYIGPDPVPDSQNLALYLHKDPKEVSSPGPTPNDSFFHHDASWVSETLSDGQTYFRVAQEGQATGTDAEGYPIYRFTFSLSGNGCTLETCLDSDVSRTDQNTGQPLPTEWYREDFGVYDRVNGHWLKAQWGKGGNPNEQANAWFSIELVSADSVELPGRMFFVRIKN